MPKSHDELQVALDRLLLQVPRLMRQSRDRDDFWPMFAAITNPILDSAGPEDFDWVSSQITAILQDNRLTPPEA